MNEYINEWGGKLQYNFFAIGSNVRYAMGIVFIMQGFACGQVP